MPAEVFDFTDCECAIPLLGAGGFWVRFVASVIMFVYTLMYGNILSVVGATCKLE